MLLLDKGSLVRGDYFVLLWELDDCLVLNNSIVVFHVFILGIKSFLLIAAVVLCLCEELITNIGLILNNLLVRELILGDLLVGWLILGDLLAKM